MQQFPSTPRGDRLQAIAKELTEALAERSNLILALAANDQALAAARLNLMPETGWPGKNETERKASQALAEDGDLDFCAARDERHDLEAHQVDLNLRIEILATERRAHEQSIQDEQLAFGIRTFESQHP
jgi:hypothetical protein